MKYLNYRILLLIIGVTFSSTTVAQKQNEKWTFGNNEWSFDTNQNNGFQRSELTTFAGYAPASASDPETGALLFYTNGLTIYDKNGGVMSNGTQLAGIPTPNSILERFYEVAGYCGGNRTNQGSIILPKPGVQGIYYVFTSVRTVFSNCEGGAQYNEFYNFGIQYAEVDMNANGGLGTVTSKHNQLNSNGSNAMTTTAGSNENYFWLVTVNGNSFYSYKIDTNGIAAPVVSVYTSIPFQSIKISKGGNRLAGSKYGGTPVVFDFDNATGAVTNPDDFLQGDVYYTEEIGSESGIEFSPNGNILYFLTSAAESSQTEYNYYAAIAMYNISTGQVAGGYYIDPEEFHLPEANEGMVLQRADNDNVYIQFYKIVTPRFYPVENDIWGVIDNPNIWNPNVTPISTIAAPADVYNIRGFPQLIPEIADGCLEDLVITDAVINGAVDIQEAENTITALNQINNGGTAEYDAGISVTMTLGFHAKAGSIYRAYIDGCDAGFGKNTTYENESIQIVGDTEALNPTLKSLRLFPNPTQDSFYIESEEPMLEWRITNHFGSLQQGNKLSAGNATKAEVDISNYPTGVYFVTAIFEDGKIVQKMLVKE